MSHNFWSIVIWEMAAAQITLWSRGETTGAQEPGDNSSQESETGFPVLFRGCGGSTSNTVTAHAELQPRFGRSSDPERA